MVDKFTVDFPAFDGNRSRRAYVYLPTDYDDNEDRRYPVLYMFDGQNVFFDDEATYGRSWRLGDYLDFTDTGIIVAAVECNGSPDNGRLSEYSPFDFSEDRFGSFKGRGYQTMKWLVHKFKPLIDSSYRTLRGRTNTFIAGSSMGGLMSIYALIKFNRVFSRAAALSPSIWVDPNKLDELITDSKISPNTLLYMDYGKNELDNHSGMVKGFAHITSVLLEKGVILESRIVPDGYHNEASWDKQTPFFMDALLYGKNG